MFSLISKSFGFFRPGGNISRTMRTRSMIIGIRREEKNRWECRSPLTPAHVRDLLKGGLVDQVIVQPSGRRVFTDAEFEKAGARISQDLEPCDLVMGVKEIPENIIQTGKTYMCFSHTHKGQPGGRKLLASLLEQRSTLIDYELMMTTLADGANKRLVAFGKFAGYAGFINCLHGLGDRLLHLGYRTPFVNVPLAHRYASLEEAQRALKLIGELLKSDAGRIPETFQPLIFVFTGKGNVSRGAQEMFSFLPHRKVHSRELRGLVEGPRQPWMSHEVVGCVAEPEDYYLHNYGVGVAEEDDGCSTSSVFTVREMSMSPESYRSVFEERIAPWTSVLVNGIYWDPRMPRLLNRSRSEHLQKSRLITIADITCDIGGSIEFTDRATTIDAPFYLYNPRTDTFSTDFSSKEGGILMMTIDNLPTQLPRDASEYFGECLYPIVQNALKITKETGVPFVETPIIAGATIVKDGQLTREHAHLQIDQNGFSQSQNSVVVVLGSGFVSGPVLEHLSSIPSITQIILGSDNLEEAKQRAKGLTKVQVQHVRIGEKEGEGLESVISKGDLVISLVPATLHLPIAKACLQARKHLVTASYLSPGMQALHKEATNRGLLFLNEVGLDPGLDHLSALDMFDQVRSNGDQICGFTSWCGGLPAPEAADNPLGYKFSWSPRGVLLATRNEARYLEDGREIVVPGDRLLASARPVKAVSPAFALEGIPNRNSLQYIPMYGLQGISTMMRGTLRYSGFSKLMEMLVRLGLLSLDPLPLAVKNAGTWSEAIHRYLGGDSFEDRLGLSYDSPEMTAFMRAAEWLGILSAKEPFPAKAPTMLDALCELLQAKLQYAPGERDMVIMQHEVLVRPSTAPPDCRSRYHLLQSSFIQYGDARHSAMARTVGIPVAVAAEMILSGQINERGVLAPTLPSIYRPLYQRLREKGGFDFKESFC